MQLIRWTPRTTNDLARMQREMDQLFGQLWPAVGTASPAVIAPPVDIEETTDGFLFRADLPGFRLEDVKVRLHGDTLTLSGERRLSGEQAKGATHRRERAAGTFERSFTLDAPVRGGDIKATYKDGVLEVRVPKAEEARAREIEVQLA